ncbi:MAG: hypothetical protein WC657_07700, partial [Candidatus Paceibacterota bacterium]
MNVRSHWSGHDLIGSRIGDTGRLLDELIPSLGGKSRLEQGKGSKITSEVSFEWSGESCMSPRADMQD